MVRSSYNTSDAAAFLYPWHNDSICNVLFFDGHVKAYNAGASGQDGTEMLYSDGLIGNHDWESSKISHWYWKR